ncbi:MAG TPA: glycoside hydrolase family 15 protein [Micropepsaceae bacterium]|nr:glycoside hydrolase family 15 protein [Micropepsaceae bacterium]
MGEFALIGDCRTAALVSRQGSIDWLCLPHFSGSSVFAALLDPDAGHFAIHPTTPFRATRRYAEDTAVLETKFTTADGCVCLRDAMTIMDGVTQLRPMREIIRIVEGAEGEVPLEVEIDVRPGYGKSQPRLRRHAAGWAILFGNEILIVQSDVPLEADGYVLRGRFRSVPGSAIRFSLAYTHGETAIFPPLHEAGCRVEETLKWWSNWSQACRYHGPYRDAVLRSALTLKLLIHALSGAVVAAPTTSLPETIGRDDTYDYRYCWLRDAGFTIDALTCLGFHEDAADYLTWLLHSTRLSWPKLRVLYDVYGRDASKESNLSHLAGYCQSRPVRTGNQAGGQLQLDAYGHVVLAAERYVSGGGKLGSAETRMLRGLGKTVCREWKKPDNGIWEIRGAKRHYTFSKLMCWVALDRLLKLHREGHMSLGSLEHKFTGARDTIADAIDRHGFHTELKSYVADFDSNYLDASLLLIPVLGFKEASDPRFAGTLQCIHERLSQNGLIYRYETGYGARGYRENSFGVCTFWAVQALAAEGRYDEAEEVFRNALNCANDVLLFGEEIDPGSGRNTGNFPQGLTHVGLINAALALENPNRMRGR